MASTVSPILIFALVVLPLLGALIAWAGDVIGYRLGRTRRTLFGLRPRTTARLVGAFVGAVLPLAGLGFAMAVSQDARDAILRIRQLRHEAEQLSKDNTVLAREKDRAQTQAHEARQETRAASRIQAEAEARLHATRLTLQSSRSALTVAQASLATTRDRLTGARAELTRARGDLGKARTDLNRARTDLNRAKTDLSKAKTDLSKAKTDLQKAADDLKKTQDDLGKTSTDLAQAKKDMGSYKAELEVLDATERHIASAEEHLKGLEDELARSEEELADTRQALDRYKFAARAVVEQAVAFEPGSELIRAIVESARSQDQLEVILGEVLNYAGAAATRHGIAQGPGGRSVRLVAPVPPGTPLSRLTENDIIAEVARQIREGSSPTYVVIVRSWGRAFDDQADPMAVEFWAAPNKVIFKAGEIVLAAEVDGSQPRAQVFRLLWQAVTDIRRVAANRGMLPSPKTGRFGEVPAEELLDAMDRVLEVKGPARISIVAQGEARVAQPEDAPMMVRLNVTKAEQE